ncbi:hypothetical protein [Caballeronia insecticola]|uniref:Uncharacterized protein n=1 Tax=Caballeronia insecticola TaxID=758793 RepID=R4X3T9_9BURK|nr:hypothetical protein [Caballeronia insecticola]BAN26692.1 putative uncharacterized protein [Caballeronia insecticola]
MVAFIIYLLDALLDSAERKRRDAFIARAKDLPEAERRMRALENSDAFR